jgi:nitrile hydratase
LVGPERPTAGQRRLLAQSGGPGMSLLWAKRTRGKRTDHDFKQRLLAEPSQTLASLGYAGMQGEHTAVVENTPRLHNMVVCTLCSCYPWPVLGLPPVWYKSGPYRSCAVMDPRSVLHDFGVELPADTEIRVWDSTAEMQYLVLPMRPLGTEGWSEEQFASIVTRDIA